jgi:hypothetical protein
MAFVSGKNMAVSVSLFINRVSAVDENKEASISIVFCNSRDFLVCTENNEFQHL